MTFRHSGDQEHPIPPEVEQIGGEVVDATYRVYRGLGPGLLESVYQICVADVLARKGLTFRQKPELDIEFEGRRIPGGLEPDFVVEDSVILELKATEEIHPVFKAQVLTYLRLSGLRLGYLVNFNVPRFGQGIKRFIYTGSRPQQDLDP